VSEVSRRRIHALLPALLPSSLRAMRAALARLHLYVMGQDRSLVGVHTIVCNARTHAQ
jgi:hypothetical protein